MIKLKIKECSEIELIQMVKRTNNASAIGELSKRYQPLYHDVTASLHINDHYAEYQNLFNTAITQAAQRYIYDAQDTDTNGSFSAILHTVFSGIASISKQQHNRENQTNEKNT